MVMEDYNLLVSIGTLFVLTCTLVVLYLNLKVVRQAMRDQHEWYRRIEALKYSGFFNPRINECRSRLNEKFQNLNANNNISLTRVKEVIENDPKIEFDIRYILSYYENMGLAYYRNIIDKKTIRSMKKGALIKFYKQFSAYIKETRDDVNNYNLWSNVIKLANEWSEADTEESTPLGR